MTFLIAFVGNIFFFLSFCALAVTKEPAYSLGIQALGVLTQYCWEEIENVLNKWFQ